MVEYTGGDGMKTIEILSIPKIRHAHCFEAKRYKNNFPRIENRIEICYIFDGSVTFSRGGETYTVCQGDILCNLYDVESACVADGYHCHHTFAVAVDWKYVEDLQGLHLPTVIKHSPETEEIAKMIDEIIFSAQTFDRIATRTAAIVFSILCKIDEIARREGDVAAPERSLLAAKAKTYIQNNITKPLTQTEVANYLGVSCGYLCSVFKRSEGISLIKYVNTLKLKGVYALMKKEGYRLYEAATTYGYSDPNYVSTLYKRMFGQNITES